MRFERAVPVLQVADVSRSIDWYVAAFGFDPDPFPPNPPYSFAILRRDGAEMMLQDATSSPPADAKEEGGLSICASRTTACWTWPIRCGG